MVQHIHHLLDWAFSLSLPAISFPGFRALLASFSRCLQNTAGPRHTGEAKGRTGPLIFHALQAGISQPPWERGSSGLTQQNSFQELKKKRPAPDNTPSSGDSKPSSHWGKRMPTCPLHTVPPYFGHHCGACWDARLVRCAGALPETAAQ